MKNNLKLLDLTFKEGNCVPLIKYIPGWIIPRPPKNSSGMCKNLKSFTLIELCSVGNHVNQEGIIMYLQEVRLSWALLSLKNIFTTRLLSVIIISYLNLPTLKNQWILPKLEVNQSRWTSSVNPIAFVISTFRIIDNTPSSPLQRCLTKKTSLMFFSKIESFQG